MSESGRGQKGGVCMVGRNQGLGRIWKTLWIPKIAVRLDSDLFLSFFLLPEFLFCLHSTPSVECLLVPIDLLSPPSHHSHTTTPCFTKSPVPLQPNVSPYSCHSYTGQCCSVGEEMKRHPARQPWRPWPGVGQACFPTAW